MVVVSPLTTEAIIGLDFLKDHKAQIDLPNKKLYLRGSQAIPLQEQSECTAIPCRRVKVRTKGTTRLPPRSEMEVLACLDEAVEQGTWMLEQALDKNLPAVVARALVGTGTHQVPIRLLNPGAEEITIYAGTQIATIERVEILQSISTVSNDESPTATAEEQAVLWGLVENLEHELTKEEQNRFFQFIETLLLPLQQTSAVQASYSTKSTLEMLLPFVNLCDACHPIAERKCVLY